MNTQIKSGYLTTEFYVTLAVTVLIGYLVTHGVIDAKYQDTAIKAVMTLYGILVASLPTIIYTLSRTWLKAKQQPSQPVKPVMPALPLGGGVPPTV